MGIDFLPSLAWALLPASQLVPLPPSSLLLMPLCLGTRTMHVSKKLVTKVQLLVSSQRWGAESFLLLCLFYV